MTKIDYKNTLNLPNTAFPMRANLPQKELSILEKWQLGDLYAKVCEHNQGRPKFILHWGPPYANGDIHIGHALTSILKDIVVKSKILSGYDSPLVPGWDCHGLPIEVNVEKKMGSGNADVTPQKFRHACREYAKSQIVLQKASFQRLGLLADWEHPYQTMDFTYEADVMRAIGEICSKGHLQRRAKPVHWCIDCGSALAEAEVEYQNKNSPAIDVCFWVEDPKAFLDALMEPQKHKHIKQIAFVIWTTTPWTLPANQAVTLHPDLEYAIVEGNFGPTRDAICLLHALVPQCMARYGIEDYQVVALFKGSQVEGIVLKHPLFDRHVPIILGEHVTTEAGTGAVHTAPSHGLDDYLVGLKYQLPMELLVNGKGCFIEGVPEVGGRFIFKANDKIIELLGEKGNLLHQAILNHSYPHCWRHKTPIIFRATPQWFISMDNHHLREHALKAIEKVQWVPEWGESRIRLMVQERPDWCISRQRTWGVPLPLLLHRDTQEIHPEMEKIIEWIASHVEKEGLEAWHHFKLEDLPFENAAQYEKSTDILDVWFESGVSHKAVLKRRPALHFPADLYLEGSDQHRGWFQSSLLSSVAMEGRAPFQAVLTHGFTVDAQGRKMSKSLGNVVAPDKVVKTLGADILRLWVSATDYKGEIHVSDEILNRMADAYRRIRNTIRFLLANLDGFDPNQHMVSPDKLLPLDAWIVDFAATLQQDIIHAYENYQYHLIYQKIHNFCVVELGSFYLDVIKDRQYTSKENALARRSAQTAMYYIVQAFTRWIAPILSFTAEEIWEYLPGEKSETVFMAQWMHDLPTLKENATFGNDFWQTMIYVRSQVNQALEKERNAGKIGSPLEADVILYVTGELETKLKSLHDELRFVLITSKAQVLPLDEKDTAALPTEHAYLWVKVLRSMDEKCPRCWHHVQDVNQDENYPGLCGRCVTNVAPNQKGESRHYV